MEVAYLDCHICKIVSKQCYSFRLILHITMASTEDREVLQEVWSGRIPTMFSLAEDDCKETVPDPCYLMLPRMSYLPLATEKVVTQQQHFQRRTKATSQVRKHFSSFLSGDSGEMWFSYHGSPLRWHHPIGLLYDLLAADGGQDGHLPWSLTVHFSQFPAEQLLPCHAREQV